MIIECEKCGTKFRMDDSLLSARGSKVRCSICKHAFIVYPPEPPQVEEPEEISLEDRIEEKEKPVVEEPEEISFDYWAEEGEQPAVEEPEEISREDWMEVGEEPEAEELEEISFADAIEEEEKPAAGEPEGISFDDWVEEGEQLDVDELFDTTPEELELDKFEASSPDDFERLLEEEEEKGEEPGIMPWETMAVGEEGPSKRKSSGNSIGRLLVFLLLLVLASGAAVYFLAPEWIPESLEFLRPAKIRQGADLGVRRLAFENVTGSFFESRDAGSLFVVEGRVRNECTEARKFILLKGNILDDDGAVVREKEGYAGNVFSKKEIETLPLDSINKALLNREGEDGTNLNVPPGKSIPFMIIFENLPENITEFTIEAVRSSPASGS